MKQHAIVFGRGLIQLVTFAMIATSMATVAFAEDERIERLSGQDRELAEYMKAFISDMDAKYFERIGEMNGELEFEDRTAETEYSGYDLRVTRGEVMEKAGRMLSAGKKQSPARGDKELVWSRFYSLDMHPKTPLVGMLHATIVLQFFADGSSSTGGFLGVMPATKIAEDLDYLKELTDAYFAEAGKDPSLYRRLMCKGTEDTVFEFRRKPACSGVSFYGPPVYRGDTQQSYLFIEEIFDQFVGAFLDITEKRADDAYTDADIAAQDDMRKRWLIDQLYSDPYASSIVPFQAWFMANVPPVIKF